MRNLLKYISYSLCLVLSTCFFTQTHAQDARSSFEQATVAYDAGKYKESLFYANEAERALGKTNAKIQSLKTILYYEQGDLKNAQLQLAIYFKTSPDQSSSEYEDMKNLRDELSAAVKEAQDAAIAELKKKEKEELNTLSNEITGETEKYHFSVAKAAGTLAAMELFLSKYPSGAFAAQATNILNSHKSELRFGTLLDEGDELMLKDMPKAAEKKYIEADKIKSTKEVAAKIARAGELKAIMATSQANTDFYHKRWASAITNYTEALSVKDVPELREKIKEAKEELEFEDATKGRTAEAYKNYINKYPGGLYVATAEGRLLDIYLTTAEKKISENATAEVKANLDDAWSYHNTVIWTHYDERYFKIAGREAARLTSGNKKFRIANVSTAIDYYEQLNSGSGTDYKSKLSHLKSKRKAWSRDDYGYVAFRTNDKIDQVGVDVGFNANTSTSAFISFRGTLKGLQETGSNPFVTNGLQYYSMFANLNFTRKIVYPVWIYAGGGYANYTKIDAVAGEPEKGIITEENRKGEGAVNIESGLIFNLKPLTFSAGASFPMFNSRQKELLNIKNSIVLSLAVGIRYVL